MISVGVVGARGYVGGELLRLIAAHPRLELRFATSRAQVGVPVPGFPELVFLDSDPALLTPVDALFLALPDGASKAYVGSEPPRQPLPGKAGEGPIIIDLSADHRFTDEWHYGLPEIGKAPSHGETRISNPGCYATAVQLAIWPLLPLLSGTPHAFGVSGYSGAGTTPSPRNNPELLNDGITPYKLINHTHEREVSRQMGCPVRFSPHVAPFFRGITVTIQAETRQNSSIEELLDLYKSAYRHQELIQLMDEEVPRLQDIVNTPKAAIGGITLGQDSKQLAVVCVIDNLLKGAASQAIQNLNCAMGWDPVTGLEL